MERVDYLRLSVTDRCNLNCLYCAPLEKRHFLAREEVLSYEEMERLVRVFAGLGVTKVRITGGEPLLKRDIASLIAMLKNIWRSILVWLWPGGAGLAGWQVQEEVACSYSSRAVEIGWEVSEC